jgi:hypothetical protein
VRYRRRCQVIEWLWRGDETGAEEDDMTKKDQLLRIMAALDGHFAADDWSPADQDRLTRTQAPCRAHARCARLRAVDSGRRAVDVSDGAQARRLREVWPRREIGRDRQGLNLVSAGAGRNLRVHDRGIIDV